MAAGGLLAATASVPTLTGAGRVVAARATAPPAAAPAMEMVMTEAATNGITRRLVPRNEPRNRMIEGWRKTPAPGSVRAPTFRVRNSPFFGRGALAHRRTVSP